MDNTVKKIVLVGTFTGYGGIQTHLKKLKQAVNEEGIDTLSICLRDSDLLSDSLKNSDDDIIVLKSLMNQQQLNPLLSKYQTLITMKNLIKQFSPDIYLYVGTGWNAIIPPCLTFGRFRRIFHEVMSIHPPGAKWNDSRWGVRWGFNEVIAQSSLVAENFSYYFNWRKPISVLPAFPESLELDGILPKKNPYKVKLGNAKCAFFSRLVPHKQAFWLVQQWDRLKDFLGELHIHGSGPEEILIREYIKTTGIGDRVKCFGSYPNGQSYIDILSSYDLFLLPTIGAEGAPLVLLESMACGVPFVAYGVGGIPDYGLNNPDVLVVDVDPEVFIAGVQQIVNQLAKGEINQARLQQYYLDNYSYQVLKQSWLAYLSAKILV